MTFLILFTVGVLCLIFKSTRLVGVVGLTILMLLVPGLFLLLLLLVCVFLYFNFKRRLRKHVQPQLHQPRD
jgi:hypothetical protein